MDERAADNPDDDYMYSFNVCGPTVDYPDEKCRTKKSSHGIRQFCQDNNLNDDGVCKENMSNYTGKGI